MFCPVVFPPLSSQLEWEPEDTKKLLGDQERMPMSLAETRLVIVGQGPGNLISFTNVRVQILIDHEDKP